MFNAKDRLELILTAINRIENRMKKISTPDDFVKDDDGDTILDSINARLQTIGENFE